MDAVIATLMEFWFALCQMAPYLLFGFFVAGVLSVFVSPRFVERHLGGGVVSVVKAAILGIPLPLCSCGVIPVAASLRRHGASPGATTSFLISTPQTGVDSLFVTYIMLGGVMAVFRPIAAFVSGVLGGALVRVFGAAPAKADEPTEEAADTCAISDPKSNRFVEMLRYGFVTLPADIGRALVFGLLLAGVITVFVEPGWFATTFGRGFGAMVAMLVVGIPFYVCATASVPLAMAMIAHQSVSPGAALVFLMTGPATNAATITTIWKIMGRRAAILYVAAVMVTALASGLLLDGMFPSISESVIAGHKHATEGGVGWFGAVSGIALVLVLLPAVVRPIAAKWKAKRRKEPYVSDTNSLVLSVEGMTCSHCAGTVERVLTECLGVQSAKVDLAAGEATVIGDGLDLAALCEAVGSVGYAARESGADAG